jgi:hypothetical protein
MLRVSTDMNLWAQNFMITDVWFANANNSHDLEEINFL